MELFWDPDTIEFTEETPQEVRDAMKLEIPRGFSGSLVWNTWYADFGLRMEA